MDQGTVSRWERGVESPRPASELALRNLLLAGESRRAMLRSIAFVRQDYMPSTLLDKNLRVVEMSASARRHYLERGMNPDILVGLDAGRFAARLGVPDFEKALHDSKLFHGEVLLLRFVVNNGGRGHSTVYEPIFEDGNVIGALNFVTNYFALPKNRKLTIELMEVVPVDDPSTSRTLRKGPNWDAARRALQNPKFSEVWR